MEPAAQSDAMSIVMTIASDTMSIVMTITSDTMSIVMTINPLCRRWSADAEIYAESP